MICSRSRLSKVRLGTATRQTWPTDLRTVALLPYGLGLRQMHREKTRSPIRTPGLSQYRIRALILSIVRHHLRIGRQRIFHRCVTQEDKHQTRKSNIQESRLQTSNTDRVEDDGQWKAVAHSGHPHDRLPTQKIPAEARVNSSMYTSRQPATTLLSRISRFDGSTGILYIKAKERYQTRTGQRENDVEDREPMYQRILTMKSASRRPDFRLSAQGNTTTCQPCNLAYLRSSLQLLRAETGAAYSSQASSHPSHIPHSIRPTRT